MGRAGTRLQTRIPPFENCGIRWDQNPRVLQENSCRFGRNGAAETVRVRAAALPTCSCGKDFAWHCGGARPNGMMAGLLNMPGWQDSNFGSRKENNPSPGVILRSTCPRTEHAWWPEPDRSSRPSPAGAEASGSPNFSRASENRNSGIGSGARPAPDLCPCTSCAATSWRIMTLRS
jgi:hypothetical protein